MTSILLTNGDSQYRIIDREEARTGTPVAGEPRTVAETDTYSLYICEFADAEGEVRQGLLQIATSRLHNGSLDRTAFTLREHKRSADFLEEVNARRTQHEISSKPNLSDKERDRLLKRRLEYDRLAPLVVDNFICAEQDHRRIVVLAIKDVPNVTDMVPLWNLINEDQVRAGLPSSAWIMGRLLKLLGFTHAGGTFGPILTPNNVLIQPDRHFVVVLDWTYARTAPHVPTYDQRAEDIAWAAKTVFAVIGGDPRTGEYPYDAGGYQRYVDFIWRLASRREHDAEKAHAEFYKLVHELFGRKFMPFEMLPR